MADVLSGKAYPSGKLTSTFPIRFEDHASTANFPVDLKSDIDLLKDNQGEKKYDRKDIDFTRYSEDIYVGYRYFDTFGKQVSYPFGYGLSYTTFDYSNPAIEENNGIYTVRVTVKNTGKRPGKEVVQLYVAAPNRVHMNKPEKELKSFAKTKELKPGESETVTMTVNTSDLASFDENASGWVVDAGTYDFLVGASSADIKALLRAEVKAAKEEVKDILKLKNPINTLKRN